MIVDEQGRLYSLRINAPSSRRSEGRHYYEHYKHADRITRKCRICVRNLIFQSSFIRYRRTLIFIIPSNRFPLVALHVLFNFEVPGSGYFDMCKSNYTHSERAHLKIRRSLINAMKRFLP